MKTGIIYRATNIISKKCYIGLTTKSLEQRINGHYRDSKNHTYAFANALRKYNKEDWNWEILYRDIPKNTLRVAEVCSIYLYDSHNSGYNSTDGGEDNPMNYPEYRKKVGQSKIGRARPDVAIRMAGCHVAKTDAQKEALSIRFSGASNPMFGKTHTEETRLKISLTHGSKDFCVFDNTGVLVGTWINKKECGRFLGVDNSSIGKCLKGKQKNSLGYTFVYKIED